MPQIRLENVSFGYVEPLFTNITLTIADNDKVGIVGNNGAGKSSLIKCIVGKLEPTEGRISRPGNLRFGFIEQDVPKALHNQTLHDVIAEAIPADERDYNMWKVEVALDTFKAPKDVVTKPICELSGGWQRLALITRTWVSNPDMLLLDEPTNHLDLEKIFVLEQWLNEQIHGVPVICISHDRQFLDNCTNKTLFVRAKQSATYDYSYTRAKELLTEADRIASIQREKDLKAVVQLEKSAQDLRRLGTESFSNAALRKSIQIAKRAESIRSQVTEVHVERRRDIKLADSGTHVKRIVSIRDIEIKAPDGRALFSIEKLDICQGERIVVLGANGTGKTQFVHLIHKAFDNIEKAKGEGIFVSPSVRLGYLDQQLSQLPLDSTLQDFVVSIAQLQPQSVTTKLIDAGFPFAAQDKKIGSLSFGERSRLYLLGLRLSEPNFYIMDEPTNHLDVAGQEQLEQEILDHDASCVLVSHDRSFVANLGTRFCVIHNARLYEIDDPNLFYKHVIDGDPLPIRKT